MDEEARLERLLEGVEESARAARMQLLRDLIDEGCSVEELEEAAAQDRLALLPSERLLQRDERFVERYTAAEVAERSGVRLEDLRFANAALGLPMGGPDDRVHTDADVELARLMKIGVDAGVPVEAIAEINRVIARGVVAMAAASRTAAIEAAIGYGTTEREAAMFWASAAEQLVPNTTRVITLAFEAHLRRLVRSAYIGAADVVAGRTPGAREVAIAFADLVDFTRLGQSVAAEDLGRVARRLEETASTVLSPGVEIVKTIGDAVMFVSPTAPPLVETVLALIDAGAAQGPDFPPIRAGIAAGPALERAGDWFGDTVNVASRITGAARPDSAVATEAVRSAAAGGYGWEPIDPPALKGIDEAPALYLVTRGGVNPHTAVD